MITSVEYINLSMTGTVVSGTLSNSQTIANCVPFSTISGSTGTGGNLRNFFTDIWFTDTGTPTVHAQRANSGGALEIGISVVEFDSNEVKVQQGSFSFSGTSTTATVSGVDLDKTAMVHHHSSSSTNNGWSYHPTRCKFNSTTEIAFQKGGASGSVVGHWYIFEDIGTNFRVQTEDTDLISADSASDHYDYTVRDRTFLLTSYYATDPNAGYPERGTIRSYIQDDHKLFVNRSAASNSIYSTNFVIDFIDTTKAYIQYWWQTGLNDSSTITYTQQLDYPVDLDSSMVIYPIQGGINKQIGTALTNNYAAFWHINFTSASGIQLDRQASNAQGDSFWQVVDWNGYSTFNSTGTNPSPIADELIISIEEVEIELGNATSGHLISSRYGWQQLTKGQDVDNCVIFSSYRILPGGTGYNYEISAVTGFDGTRMFAHRANNSAGTFTVHAFVVEFNPTKVNVVHGYHYFTGASSNKTITSLTDYTKAFMLSNWWTDGAQGSSYYHLRNKLTSNTNIEFTRGTGSNSMNIYYFVVEDVGNNWTVQTRDNQMVSVASVTDSSFLPHVPWHNTFAITSHYATDPSAGYPERGTIIHYHYHYNRFTLDRGTITSNSIYAHTFLVTFTDTSKQRVHRDYLTLSNASTTTDADLWHAVDLDSSIVKSTTQQNIRQTGTSYAHNLGTVATIKFLNDSQIQTERTHSSQWGYIMWEAIDWVGETLIGTGTNPDPWVDEMIVSIEYLEDIEVDDSIIWFELTKGQDINNCVPFVSCRPDVGMGGYKYKMLPEVWFEDPSLLYIWRSTNSGKMYYNIQVIEFNPAKIKVQQGKFNFTGTSQTTTISGVDLSRTAAITYYNYNGTSDLNYISMCRTSFPSTTEIRLLRQTASSWINAHFYVMEALNDEWIVQTVDTSAISNQQVAITPVDRSRTFIISSGSFSDSSNLPNRATTGTYLWTKRKIFTDRGSASGTMYWVAFIVEFTDHTKKYVQFNNETLASTVYTYNYDLPSVQIDQGWATTSGASTVHSTRFPGFFRNEGTSQADWEGAFGTMRLTSTSGVEIKREITACATTSYAPREVVDWVGIPYDTYTPQIVSASMTVSIETFDFQMVDGSAKKYLTLTKGQNIDNCVPFITLKGSGSAGYPYRLMPSVDFVDDNRIFIRRFSNVGTLDISLQIVEFNPAKIRVQRGDYFTTASTLNRTVSAVDTSKTFIVCYTSYESSTNANYLNYWRAYFTTSTNILFQRGAASGYTNIYYYVIESLDDSFDVEWLTMEGTGTSNTVYPSNPLSADMVLYASHYSSDSSTLPQRGLVQFYTNTEINQVVWSRADGSGYIYARAQLITFNEDQARVFRGRYTLAGAATATSVTIPDPTMNESNTVILPTETYGMTRIDYSSATVYEQGFHKQSLAAGGGAIDILRTGGYNSYGMTQAIEFIGISAYTFGGTITENEAPVDRVVRGYRADTGDFVGETTSSGGAWELSTTYSGEHYVVCLDDLAGFDYNDLIYGGLVPATISG